MSGRDTGRYAIDKGTLAERDKRHFSQRYNDIVIDQFVFEDALLSPLAQKVLLRLLFFYGGVIQKYLLQSVQWQVLQHLL